MENTKMGHSDFTLAKGQEAFDAYIKTAMNAICNDFSKEGLHEVCGKAIQLYKEQGLGTDTESIEMYFPVILVDVVLENAEEAFQETWEKYSYPNYYRTFKELMQNEVLDAKECMYDAAYNESAYDTIVSSLYKHGKYNFILYALNEKEFEEDILETLTEIANALEGESCLPPYERDLSHAYAFFKAEPEVSSRLIEKLPDKHLVGAVLASINQYAVNNNQERISGTGMNTKLHCGKHEYEVTPEVKAELDSLMYWIFEAKLAQQSGIRDDYARAQDTVHCIMEKLDSLDVPNWVGNGAIAFAESHDLRACSTRDFFEKSVYAKQPAHDDDYTR